MAKVDARVRIERLRKSKSKNNPKSQNNNAKVSDLRELIGKKSARTTRKSIEQRALDEVRRLTKNFTDFRKQQRPHEVRKKAMQRHTTLGQGLRTVKRDTIESRNPRTSRVSSIGLPPRSGVQTHHFVHPNPPTPTYIIAAAPQTSNLAMDNVPESQSASVLVSNLIPTITQSEIIELFGDIGVMTAVNMINQTTALVTYQNSSDAVRAVKVYNSRLLDGKPMYVNMMPGNTQVAPTNVRSRIGRPSLA